MIASTSPSQHDGSDDLDRLLGRFFRGEVPAPWPALAAPVMTPAAVGQGGTPSAGRMALAASIALLLFGGWFLSGRLPAPVTGSLDNGNATVPRGLQPTPHTVPNK